MRLSVILVAALFLTSTGHGEEPAKSVTIPLDQIWALDMPGTRRITTNRDSSTGEFVAEEGPILLEVLQNLASWKASTKTRQAFAVQGAGLDALRNVAIVLTGDRDPSNSFNSHQPVTVAFFSREYGKDVHIQRVTRRGTRVEIQYQFVPHIDAGISSQFALIPLGALPPGTVSVDVVPKPMEDKFVEWGIEPVEEAEASRIVSGSFSFEVEEPSKKSTR